MNTLCGIWDKNFKLNCSGDFSEDDIKSCQCFTSEPSEPSEASELIDKLTSMCRAAATELESQWGAHCGSEGYGPINLLARLKGDTPPDYYLAHLPEDHPAQELKDL